MSKWKKNHAQDGTEGLRLGYQGSRGYLTGEEKANVLTWIEKQSQISIEQLRDHLETKYGVVYRSKQSYYDLLQAGGMSYHRSTAVNPKRDKAQILEKREAIKKKWLNTKSK